LGLGTRRGAGTIVFVRSSNGDSGSHGYANTNGGTGSDASDRGTGSGAAASRAATSSASTLLLLLSGCDADRGKCEKGCEEDAGDFFHIGGSSYKFECCL